jgi:tetratricopeptide (TPR) repeat protein
MMIRRLVQLAGVAAACIALGACAARKPLTTHQQSEQNLREAATLATQAERAQRAGDHPRAVELGRQAVTMYPSLGAAWNNLGISLMETQQNLDAVQAFQRAAELLPTDPKPYENLGLLYYRVGWAEDALKYYELSMERDQYWLPSLRGAAISAKSLLRSSDAILERAKRGLLIETDPKWRKVFEDEQMRVSGELAERSRGLRISS